MTEKVTEEHVIKKVLEEYSDPSKRSLYKNREGGTCQYQNSNGKKCAVGKFMTNEALDTVGASSRRVAHLESNYGLDNLLKKEYQGFPVSFWNKLQVLHDSDQYWSEDGVTGEGLEYIKREIGVSI